MKGKTVKRIVVVLMVAGLFVPLTSFAGTVETTAGIRFIDPSPVPHNDLANNPGQKGQTGGNGTGGNGQFNPGETSLANNGTDGFTPPNQGQPAQNTVYPITKGAADSTGNGLLDKIAAHAYPKTGSLEDWWLYAIPGIELLLILLLVLIKRAKEEKTNEEDS